MLWLYVVEILTNPLSLRFWIGTGMGKDNCIHISLCSYFFSNSRYLSAHDLIGRVTTTLREMSVMKELQLINPQKKTRPLYRNSGLLMVDKCVRVS